MDDKLKSYLQKYVSRGKLEVFVYVEPLEEEGGDVSVNLSLARSYQRALLELRDGLGMADGAFGLMDIARLPDVLSVHRAPEDEAAVWTAVREVVDEAAGRFCAMRETEGGAAAGGYPKPPAPDTGKRLPGGRTLSPDRPGTHGQGGSPDAGASQHRDGG